jgi:hypothetical protein
LTRHHDLSEIAVWIYQHMHTGFTMGVLLLCYLAGPTVYRPARNALVLMNLVGLVVFFLLPVMPPRLLPGSGFVDSVALAGFGTAHSPGPVAADQYAAMPSLHLGWAVWVTIVVMALLHRFRVRWIAVLHPIVTAIVVVVTANHYVLDVVAGTAVALATCFGTGLVWAGSGTAYAGGQLIRRNRKAPPAAVPDASAVSLDKQREKPEKPDGADETDAKEPAQAASTAGAATSTAKDPSPSAAAVEVPSGITRADPDKAAS